MDAAESADIEPLIASTNLSEGQNSGINKDVRYCESIAEQLSIIKKWKVKQIDRFHEHTLTNYWHAKRRPETAQRHCRLNELVNEYLNIGIVNQVNRFFEIAKTIGILMMKTNKKSNEQE